MKSANAFAFSRRNFSLTLLAAAVSAAFSGGIVHAQQAPAAATTASNVAQPQPSPPSSATARQSPAAAKQKRSDSTVNLKPVTVTATRRAKNIETVPLAITAISGDELEHRGISDIHALDQAVPGLTFENSGDNPTPIIRGAGAAGTADVAVPFYVDGVYQPNFGQGLVSFVDLNRVEVLKGPQGTLFGRNTLGGLINLVSNKPVLQSYDGGAAVTFGNYSERKLEGFVNIPIGDTWAARVAISREQHDPYVRNLAVPGGGIKDADYSYVRAQLLWQPSDSFKADLTGTYWHDTSAGNSDFSYKVLGIPVNATTRQVDGVNGFLDQRQGLRDGWGGGKSQTGNISNGDSSAMITQDPYNIAWDYNPRRKILAKSAALNVTWDFMGNELNANASVFNYDELRTADGDGSTNASFVSGQSTLTKSYQVDLNLHSTWESPLQYTVGAYLFDDKNAGSNSGTFLFGYINKNPQKPTWASWLTQNDGGIRSEALYGQADYSLTKKLTATVGLRWNRDQRDAYQLKVDPSTLNDPLPSFGGPPVNVQNGTSHKSNYRVGLQYQLAPQTMLYAYEATGYIPGGTQVVTNALLAPSTNRTIELGAKTAALDNRLVFNVAVYSAKYSGLTTSIFVTQGQTAITQQVPGGSMKSSGVEMDATWIPIDRMRVQLGIAAERSTLDKFTAADLLGTDGASFIDNKGAGWFILDGKPSSFSPDLTANLGLSYSINLGGMGSLEPAVFTKYSSSYKTTNEPYFWSLQPAYTVVNASLTWVAPGDEWSVKAFVNNAGNTAVMTRGVVFSGARAFADFNNPRVFGVRIAYRM